MAQRNVLKLIYAALLSIIVIKLALCTRNATYIEYGMENNVICHPFERKNQMSSIFQKKSKINKLNNSAVLVKANHKFDHWDVHYDVYCKFTVKANRGDGLFGVIQKMSLRRNGTHCIDYVQFKRSDEHRTEKFCGQMNRSKTRYYLVPEPDNSSYGYGPSSANTYSEFDINHSGGELQTNIFISKEKLQPGEFLDLTIVYTPYKDCKNVDLEEFKSIGYNTCIWKPFFCDGIQNCAPNICLDEAGCQNYSNDVISTGTGTKVTVGAVTSMILCFIILIMCMWICKKHGLLCWSHTFSNPSECAVRQSASVRPGLREAESSLNPQVPTAPMLEEVVPPTVSDKDLPPTYDSLFPERSNPTTS